MYGRRREDVERQLDEIRTQIQNGTPIVGKVKFADMAEIWCKEHRRRVSVSTFESYGYALRILNEHFGGWNIQDIRGADIEHFLWAQVDEGRSHSYVSKLRAMLFQIMKKALAYRVITVNPLEYVEDIYMEQTESKPRSYTLEEVQRLLDGLPENRIGWSIRLMLGTGMRTQELLGLEPRHIAPDGSTIRIEQAVVREKGMSVIGTPKSKKSYRTIPVPENVRYCAVNLRSLADKFVWESPKRPGMPCNPSHFQSLYEQATTAVEGVQRLTPHACRHTYISQLQGMGVTMETIQSIVGHADVDMTRDYLDVIDPKKQEAIAKFAAVFSCAKHG